MPRPSPRLAVSLFFGLSGMLSATWIARIPAMSSRLDLGAGQLGFILLAIAFGAIAAFSMASGLVSSRGSRWATSAFGLALCGTIALVSFSWSPWVLVVTLFAYGFAFGGVDVSMNAQGVEVEHTGGRNIIGSLHGFFSLGSMAGAGLSGAIAALDVDIRVHFPLVSAISFALLLWATTGLIPDRDEEPRAEVAKPPRFALPSRGLWPLGIIAFCAAIGEGGMADWSALHVHESLGASEGVAAFAFTFFSLTMLIGRFLGDTITGRYGNGRVIRLGAIVAAVGYIAGILVDTVWSVIAGYGLLGIGLSVVIPVVYRAAGNAPGFTRGHAVASVATVGYSGFLAAPPVLGLLAEVASLQISMLVIGLLCLCIIPLANATEERAPDHSLGA